MRRSAGAPGSAAAEPTDSWTRTLWLMVVVQFIMSASQTSSAPILPLYLPELGIRAPGSVAFWSGVLNAVTFLVSAFLSPFWGSVADRHGRKMMVIRSGLANCILQVGMGFSHHLWQLVTLRALIGGFSGFSAAAIALVATQAPRDRLGFALGWLSTGQLVGALVGPVLGGALADLSGSYRLVFFVTAAIATTAAVLAHFGVVERFSAAPARDRPAALRGLVILAQTSGLLPIFITILVAQLGVRSVQPIVTPFVQQLTGDLPSLATLAGFAFSITGIADLIASPFLGKRSDTIGYRRVLLISLFGAALATLPQALVENYWQFLALRFLLGLFIGGILPTANALVGRLVPVHQRGLAYGITASASFFGGFLGPFGGGSIAASVGIPWVFVVTGSLFLANLAWVFLMLPAETEISPDVAGAEAASLGD
jgi:DHA1 family multidrug resistance protein-like MFS transporter